MYVGMGIDEIETPALLIDLDAMEGNIEKMASYYRGIKGAALLPHQKGHRLPAIAALQVKSGAVGVSLSSLGLAELYVDSGIDNILITNEIQGRNKIARLCGMSRRGNVTVSVDDVSNTRQISEIAIGMGAKVKVAVELYMGPLSGGVEMGKVKSFFREVSEFDGVELRGLWWHELHGLSGTVEERRKNNFALLDEIAVLRDDLEDSGFGIEMLSGGSLSTWNITPHHPTLKDVGVQAGSYVFNDWCAREVDGHGAFGCALTVLTRCTSRPKPDEAMFDIGTNTCANESSQDYHKILGPKFKTIEGVDEIRLREEHAFADCKHASPAIRAGDVLEVIPPHCDTTAKMYDIYYGMRDGKVEVIWRNHGRGLF